MKRVVATVASFLFIIHSHAQHQDSVPDMTKDGVTLSEVVIMGNDSRRDTQMRSSQSLVRIGKSYLEMNLSGSLPQTLAGIPGVKAMNIGSGQSKPVIRGLGFNRMVVTETASNTKGSSGEKSTVLKLTSFQ